ncbi:TRAP transporter small permease [Thermodesulfobacteriota bacterium]
MTLKIPLIGKKIRLSTIEDLFTIIAAASILFIMLISVANVFGRYLFNYPVPGTVEIAAVLLVFIIFLGISGVQRSEDHIGMDTLLDLVKKKKSSYYHALQAFHFFISFLILGLIGCYFIPSMMESVEMHEWTNGPLFIPIWPFKLSIIIGCTLMCIRLFLQIIQHLRVALGNTTGQNKDQGE